MRASSSVSVARALGCLAHRGQDVRDVSFEAVSQVFIVKLGLASLRRPLGLRLAATGVQYCCETERLVEVDAVR